MRAGGFWVEKVGFSYLLGSKTTCSRIRKLLLREDQAHRLGASCRVLELPAHRTRDGFRAGFAHAAHRHAHMLGLNHNDRTARV